MTACFECGGTSGIHQHHVIPKSLGGTKTIPLCEKCHGVIHGITFSNHSELTKRGLDKAKKNGVRLGRAATLTPESEPVKIIMSMVDNGYSFRRVCEYLEAHGFKTARGGKQWYASTVKAVYDTYADLVFEPVALNMEILGGLA